MKQTIRLTESELRNMIAESVKKALNEYGESEGSQYALGAVSARNQQRFLQAMRNGNRDLADKYAKTRDLADKTSAKYTGYSPDVEQGSQEYQKRQDLYNANQRGQRNYNSYISGAGRTNYKTAPQTRQQCGY